MTARPPDKAQVLEALRARVAALREAAVRSQEKAAEGATHEEARPENDKDTRATEASYLARGLARRVVELQEAAVAIAQPHYTRVFGPGEPIAVGALVTLEDEDGQLAHYLFATHAGGLEVTVGGQLVRVVTPEAPLGRALVGRSVEDAVKLQSPRGDRELTVWAVA